MYIKRELGHTARRLDCQRPHRDIRDKATVHHIDVEVISPGGFGFGDLITEAREIGGKEGRGNTDRQRHCDSPCDRRARYLTEFRAKRQYETGFTRKVA
jgi:hypothetical protein